MFNNNSDKRLKLEKECFKISSKQFINKVFNEYDFAKQEINNYIFNVKSHQTAIFKEYLYTDDKNTEFLKRFYTAKESRTYIKKLAQFYLNFSIIYPVYYLLDSSKFLYRNINEKEELVNKSKASSSFELNKSIENILSDIKLFNKQKLKRSKNKVYSNIEKFKEVKNGDTHEFQYKSHLLNDSIKEVDNIIKLISYGESLRGDNENNNKYSQSFNKSEQNVQYSEVKHIQFTTNVYSNNNRLESFESKENNRENFIFDEYLDTKLSNQKDFVSGIKKSGEKIIQNLIEQRSNYLISLQKQKPSFLKKCDLDTPLNIKTTCSLRKNETPDKHRSLNTNNTVKATNLFLKSSTDLTEKRGISNEITNSKKSKDKKVSVINSVTIKKREFPNLVIRNNNNVFPYSSQLKVKIVDSKSYTNLNSTSSNPNYNHMEYGSQNNKKSVEFSLTNNRLNEYMNAEYKILSPDNKKINLSRNINQVKGNNFINYLQINSSNTRNLSKSNLSYYSTQYQNTFTSNKKKSIFTSTRDLVNNVSKSIKLKK